VRARGAAGRGLLAADACALHLFHVAQRCVAVAEPASGGSCNGSKLSGQQEQQQRQSSSSSSSSSSSRGLGSGDGPCTCQLQSSQRQLACRRMHGRPGDRPHASRLLPLGLTTRTRNRPPLCRGAHRAAAYPWADGRRARHRGARVDGAAGQARVRGQQGGLAALRGTPLGRSARARGGAERAVVDARLASRADKPSIDCHALAVPASPR
jgi:hypothetical protein